MNKNLTYFGIFILLAFIFWSSITLSEEYTVNLNVLLKINLPEKKYSVEGDIPKYLNLKIRTSGWEIIKLKYFQELSFELNITEVVENYNFYTNTITNEQLGLSSNSRIVSIKPEIIRISFNLSGEKRIKIYPVLKISIKEGYDIVSPIKVEPESILIRGSRKIISMIDSLPTETIELSDLYEFTSVETKIIDTLSNLIIYDRIPVKVSFDIQQIADKNFERIPIELINVPKNMDIILFPSFVDVKLRGGILILGLLQSDSIKAFVDYKKYSSELDQEIIPEFSLPFGVKVIDYSPKKFKLIFRK